MSNHRLLLRLLIVVAVARSAHVDRAGVGFPSWDAATGTCETKLADGAVVTQVEVDVAKNATVVVQQDEVQGAFIGLATLLDFLVIGLAAKAVKVSIEGIGLDDKAVRHGPAQGESR